MQIIKPYALKAGRIISRRNSKKLMSTLASLFKLSIKGATLALSFVVYFMEGLDRMVNRLLPLKKRPYALAMLPLVALFLTLLLISGESEVESAISSAAIEPFPISAPLVKTASLEPTDPFVLPSQDKLYETPLSYYEEYEPPDIDSLKELFAHRSLIDISRGSKESTELSITFDGGETDHAREILEILSEKEIETTFFLTGRFIRKNPELVNEILSGGHEVGNHTLSHPHLTDFNKTLVHRTLPRITKEYFLNQLSATAKLYKDVTGEDMAPYWRAPYGEINKELTGWALEAGYVHIGWTRDYKNRMTLDTLDWVNEKGSKNYYTAVEIKDRILAFDESKHGLNGGIILMHLGTRRRSDKAVSVLPELIDEVRMKGFSFVKVSRMARNLIDAPFSVEAKRKLAIKNSSKPSI